MKEEYPCFKEKKVRYEYSNKINNLFKQNGFNWSANSALGSPYIYVKPEDSLLNQQLNSGALPFTDITRISVNTKEGIARLGIMACPSINSSTSKPNLEKIGYNPEIIEGHPEVLFLVKPLDNLESLVDELRKIELILPKREL
jgi:hypothetical protein